MCVCVYGGGLHMYLCAYVGIDKYMCVCVGGSQFKSHAGLEGRAHEAGVSGLLSTPPQYCGVTEKQL